MSLNTFTSILGVRISNSSSYSVVYKSLVQDFDRWYPHFITVNNVHTVVEATKDKHYKNVLNESHLSLPDGKPLSIIAKLKGEKNINRIFGPTFMEKTLDWGQREMIKHYFFGGTQDTLNKMLEVIKRKYPNVLVAGKYTPPFKKEFSEEENKEFINRMNESGAHIFWIGLGAPKQELWMHENYKKLNKGIMIGIGAGFDYLAGNTKHAPVWMKNIALEWVFRLIQEPRRLWKRYLVTNTLFLWYVFLELTRLRKFD